MSKQAIKAINQLYSYMCDLILETDQVVTIEILRNTDFKY